MYTGIDIAVRSPSILFRRANNPVKNSYIAFRISLAARLPELRCNQKHKAMTVKTDTMYPYSSMNFSFDCYCSGA